VRQGLLFVKPKALPKRPVASDDSEQLQRSSGSFSAASSATPSAAGSEAWASAGSSSSSSNSAAAGLIDDAGVDAVGLPVVAEFDDPSWLVQDTWRDVPYDW
jgi:hypothetical protein